MLFSVSCFISNDIPVKQFPDDEPEDGSGNNASHEETNPESCDVQIVHEGQYATKWDGYQEQGEDLDCSSQLLLSESSQNTDLSVDDRIRNESHGQDSECWGGKADNSC